MKQTRSVSWAQAAGDGADRGTGPQAQAHIPALHFGMGFGQGQRVLGINLISASGMSLHALTARVLLTSKQRPAAPPLTPFSLVLPLRHPDKNKDPGAEDKFIQISKAYEVTHASCKLLLSLTLSDVIFPCMALCFSCVFLCGKGA